jgi:hypothetical protein
MSLSQIIRDRGIGFDYNKYTDITPKFRLLLLMESFEILKWFRLAFVTINSLRF